MAQVVLCSKCKDGVMSGDMGDPFAVRLRELIEGIMKERT